MSIGHCKTCKYWLVKERFSGGHCGNGDKIAEDDGQDYLSDMLIYEYSEGGRFWTGPEFGCVHHEEIES